MFGECSVPNPDRRVEPDPSTYALAPSATIRSTDCATAPTDDTSNSEFSGSLALKGTSMPRSPRWRR